jgi:hypothetical protein
MIEIYGDERRTVLHALLPDEDAPGDQVGWQLADHAVGQAFVDDDGRAAVVVTNRFAVLYGEPRPTIGRALYDRVFVGGLQGAVAALDVRPAVEGVPEQFEDAVRLFFDAAEVLPPAPVALDPLVLRPVSAADDEAVRLLAGAWVFEMWPRASAARYGACLTASDGEILAVASGYAQSPRYAEIAAWMDPMAAGNRLVAAASAWFLRPVIDDGFRISSSILTTNAKAQRFAEGAGWRPVAEQRVVSFPPPLAGTGRYLEFTLRP